MKRSSPPLPEEYTRRELESFHKAIAAGNEWGLADVFTFCKDHAVPLPSWALDAVMARHAEAITEHISEPPTPRGCHPPCETAEREITNLRLYIMICMSAIRQR